MSVNEQVRITYFEKKIASLIEKGKIEEAKVVLNKLESIAENQLAFFHLKTRLLEEENEFYEAKEMLKKGVFYYPTDFNLLEKLAKVSEKLNDWYQAFECYQQMEKIVSHEETNYILKEKERIKKKIELISSNTEIKKVLFIQDIQCTRTNKIANALKKKGIQVDAIYLKLHPSEMYKGIILPYTNIYKLENINKTISFINNSDYDILYSSNEPDYLTVLFTTTNKPIIHDTHDMMSLRGELSLEQMILEYTANAKSSGNIYVTDSVKNIAIEKFGLVDKPIMTINNYIDRDYLPNKFNGKLSEKDGEIHCVFEGGLASVDGHHRFLEPFFMKLIQNNIHVHLYGHVDTNYIKSLEKKSVYIHYEGLLPPHKLIQEMTKYDVGLLLFNLNKRNKVFLDTTFANKVWDYLAAGLPIAFADLKVYNSFLNEHKVGRIIDFDQPIIKQIKEIKNISIEKDYLIVNGLLMDEKIEEIITFFEKIKFNHKTFMSNCSQSKHENAFYKEKAEELKIKEMNSGFYDELYESGGYGQAYHKHYSETLYYPSWKKALEIISSYKNPNILEVGCGVGQFAQLLFDNGFKNYIGMDFSEKAIKFAKNRNKDYGEQFFVEDVYSTEFFHRRDYNVIVLFEVLEHISEDLIILEKIKSGSHVLFSVPNFDSKSHVRYFKDENEVLKRYSNIINIRSLFTFNISATNKIFLVEGLKK